MTIAAIDIINGALLLVLLATAFALVVIRNLFAVVMLSGIFSLTAAVLYVVWDAVDVAFTEASVGAGISTVLMLATLALTHPEERARHRFKLVPFLVVVATGAFFILGTLDMPRFGDPDAPIHNHVADVYIQQSGEQVGPPNIVTSVLASYRGYDTLGETTVIFTAAAGVITIIGRRRRKKSAAAQTADTEV